MRVLVAMLVSLLAAAAIPAAHASSLPPPSGIAFTAAAEDGSDIHVADPNGGGRLRLTADGVNSDPAWSPDGTALAFRRGRDEGRGDIWTMDARGGSVRRLTRDRRDDLQPAWSPDGSRIAFVRVSRSRRAPSVAIWVMNADGSGQRRLTRTRRVAVRPVWSPDGTRIAFSALRLDPDAQVTAEAWVVPAGGGPLTRLARNALPGSWSPDGSRIAFERASPGPGAPCTGDDCEEHHTDIWTMNADGSGQTRLTTATADDSSPTWSPDGRRIAFSSDRFYPLGLASELFTMNADGSCQVRITAGAAEALDGAWQPGTVAEQPCEQPELAYEGADLGAARRFTAFRLFTAGETFEGLALTDAVRSGRREFTFRYADCLDPAGACGPPVELQVEPACGSGALGPTAFAPRYRTVRGALVTANSNVGFARIHTGAVVVTVFSFAEEEENTLVHRVAAALRPLNGADPAAGEALPSPAFPRELLSTLRRTEAAVRRHGMRGAGRRLKVSRRAIRNRLALARAIRRLPRPSAADRRAVARCSRR